MPHRRRPTTRSPARKLIGTSVAGLSARYSVVGHAGGGTLDLALTADYIRQDTNKPYCKQMWHVSGGLTK